MAEDKRLRVDVAAIQELLKLHDINRIQWIPGPLQLANAITKQGVSGFHLLSFLQSGKMLNELFVTNAPGHITKMAAMPIYGKNGKILLQNH